MIRDKRIIATLKEIEKLLKPLGDALADDSLDEYADTVEDVIGRIKNLHYVITHNDLLEGQS